MIRDKNFLKRWTAAAVCFQLFWVLFDLACPASLFMPEISSMLLAVVLAARVIFDMPKIGQAATCSSITLWLTVSAVGYTVLDALSFLRSGAALFWEKYRVVGVSLLTAVGLALCLAEKTLQPKRALSVIWFAGLAVGAVAAADVFLPFLQLNPHTYRITMRADYNMYATVLFCSGIGGFGVWLKSRRQWADQLLFLLSAAFLWTMAYLSGSRRILLALLPTAVIFVVAVIKDCAEKPKLLALAAGAVVGFSLLSVGAVKSWESFSAAQEAPPSAETSLSQRYQTVEQIEDAAEENGALKTRIVLWRTAVSEIKTMCLSQPTAFLLGKGGGYDIALYDRLLAQNTDAEFSKVFAEGEKYMGKLSSHNFLLTDMLCGGVVKTVWGVVLWGAIFAAAIKALRDNWRSALPIILIAATVFANNMISNRFGFLYDKYFYISIILLVAVLKGGSSDERAKQG